MRTAQNSERNADFRRVLATHALQFAREKAASQATQSKAPARGIARSARHSRRAEGRGNITRATRSETAENRILGLALGLRGRESYEGFFRLFRLCLRNENLKLNRALGGVCNDFRFFAVVLHNGNLEKFIRGNSDSQSCVNAESPCKDHAVFFAWLESLLIPRKSRVEPCHEIQCGTRFLGTSGQREGIHR